MMFFAKEPHNIEQFKNMYNDEMWKALYKYIYYIRLDEVNDFFSCLKKFEDVGLSIGLRRRDCSGCTGNQTIGARCVVIFQ